MNEYEEHKDHLQASSDALSKFLDSEEGKEFLRNFDAKKKRIKEQLEKRFLVFEKWLKTNDFDKLMYRLINKHGEDYCRRCYDKGYEPHPNNVLGFVISYVFHRTPEVVVDELLCDFTTEVHEFRGYYFEHMWGQGMGTQVYNKEDLKKLLTL